MLTTGMCLPILILSAPLTRHTERSILLGLSPPPMPSPPVKTPVRKSPSKSRTNHPPKPSPPPTSKPTPTTNLTPQASPPSYSIRSMRQQAPISAARGRLHASTVSSAKKRMSQRVPDFGKPTMVIETHNHRHSNAFEPLFLVSEMLRVD